MQWLLLLVFGVGVGVLSGLLGIGGGVVLVPGLILLFGFSQAEAQGTSLAVLIPPIGIFAALVYYQHGYVRLPVVGLIAIGFMVGALLGAKLVPLMPIEWLRILFGVLLLYLGFTFVLSPRGGSAATALPAGVLTLVSGAIGFWGRKRLKKPMSLPPPSNEQDYFI